MHQRHQEIIKLRAEINQVETKRTIQRINKARNFFFFEKINKIDKPLASITTRHRDSIQINKIRNEKGAITTETGNLKNHQIILQKPIFNKTGKSGLNGQLSRQLPNNKVKSGLKIPSKQSCNP